MEGISSSVAGKLDNNYEYNGKEKQEKEFSDGDALGWYDYTNRFYDNQIARFFCVDKLATQYPYYSPFQFAGNEVPNAIDLDGLEPLRFNKHGYKQGLNEIGNALSYGFAALMSPFSMMGSMHAAGNAKDLKVKAELENEAKGYAAESIVNYGGGMLFGKIGGLAIGGLRGASIWKLGPSERGLAAEKLLGGNLPKNFPVIDKLENGVATSIKSVDLTLSSYNKGNGLLNTLNGYINKLSDFSVGKQGNYLVREGLDFTSKSLEVAIQPGKATLAQWDQIGKAMENARKKGIDFTLQFIK